MEKRKVSPYNSLFLQRWIDGARKPELSPHCCFGVLIDYKMANRRKNNECFVG